MNCFEGDELGAVRVWGGAVSPGRGGVPGGIGEVAGGSAVSARGVGAAGDEPGEASGVGATGSGCTASSAGWGADRVTASVVTSIVVAGLSAGNRAARAQPDTMRSSSAKQKSRTVSAASLEWAVIADWLAYGSVRLTGAGAPGTVFVVFDA